ncbi:ABC transporter ATP-binding protein [Clostridiaceae bacterium M8S5]|nr:ABC transporter ATP-binding protein [Clostridiaceae bacterium M8S5]
MKKIYKENSNVLFNLLKIIKYILHVDKKYIFIVGFSTVISGVTPAISLVIMQNIINFIQKATVDIRIIFKYIALYVLIDLLSTLKQGLIGYYNTKFSLKFNLFIKNIILKKASNLNLKDYENSEIYDMIKRAQYESNGKLLSFFNMFVGVISVIITLVSYLIILIRFKAWIVIIVMIVPIIKYKLLNKINTKQFKIKKARTDDERKAWYYSYLITNGDNYKELKIYKLFKYFIHRYETYIKKFNCQDIKIAKERTIFLSILDLAEQILNGIMFAYIVYNGYLGIILIGDVVTYTRTVISTKSQIQQILQTFANIQKESLFIDQLFYFIDFNSKENIKTKKLIKIDQIKEIRVENLFYRYKQSQDYVLRDINLTINNNELTAIVGRNGSGKTTLAKIIMGFYDDYEGKIYVNGINLRDISKKSYMNRIGALFQDFAKFEATFRENIGYGNLHIINDDDTIINIASKFNVDNIANNNEQYLETQLGYWFDKGKQISIGQWQKIALSRAFAKKADLYFLDEPNAALDAISEYNIARLYTELLDNKLGVIIAHRFNNFIKQAQNIIVMESGEIIEKGTHRDLIRFGELYKKLYDLQTQDSKSEIEIARA